MDRGRGVDRKGEEPRGLCDEHAAASIALGKNKIPTVQLLTEITDVWQQRRKEK